MPGPALPLMLGAGVVAALAILNRNEKLAGVIQPLPPGAPPPPPVPVLPPVKTSPSGAVDPATGLPPLPAGFTRQRAGDINSPIIQFLEAPGTVGFAVASDPSIIGMVTPESLRGVDLVADGGHMVVDVGAARLSVQGIPSGNMLMKITKNMDANNNVAGIPVDPRLPSGLPEMLVPVRAITGFG